MKKRYYTPEIEEFHPGFEYELIPSIGYTIFNVGLPNQRSKTNWAREYVKGIYGIEDVDPWGGTLSSIRSGIENEKCRVKYLDQEDIKSFGLTHIGGKLDGKTNQQFKGKVLKGYYLHITATHMSFGTILTIETSVYKNSVKTTVVHTITIKNKSELKKLLKQLNIIT